MVILDIASAAVFMLCLGILLASVLAIANRKLFVYEDPRIDEVEEMLPHANCGACGKPGCRPFAEALVKGELDPALCTPNSQAMTEEIADFLGVELGDHTKRVARLACAGGVHVAYFRAEYSGMKSCRAAALVSGGGKGCTWGCLGLGDCEAVCEFNAIRMNKYGLPVVDEDLCVACNDCVEVCPKSLFSIQPVTHKLWVACKSLSEGDEAEHDCEVACTACARCVADAPEGLIQIVANLAVVDYEKNDLASNVAIERCPTGAIVWIEDKKTVKGLGAKKILRMEPLPRG
ncbi:MAG: RnfABCDGE type electron transport complex subunit B [Chromatiaceae bacterium]|nr:RnfABCDGE type electron transport complex subunit B [Gammaproteobacteria bacterium]MCP5427891.1 RnfABCDGE type electron transport complex subunit B [Chromatiaceae bacterium]MCB1871186.1 RnfABCDGE type electron transport complex subunit B [Gammaproteobacteria bacterium]MCB1879401.1 RnfABCDGE type electron transport complex subunit B [Gammaproteobacteria bacterium]MCB1904856.1 RnfABCDGE type electron transport complex subunit B [Gammaproteobacteria bacterium]